MSNVLPELFKRMRDIISNALVVVTDGHTHIHEGKMFEADIVNLNMANAATEVFAFRTGAGPLRAHMLIQFVTLIGGHVDLIEGPTWDAQTGTLVSIVNRLRGSTNISFLEENQAQAGFVASGNLIRNPNTLAGGLIVHDVYAFGERNKFSAESRDTTEWMLDPDTDYAIKFTADGGPTNMMQMSLVWYEHSSEEA